MKIDNTDRQHLLKRKDAANYIDTTAGVMAVWDSIKRHDLNPKMIDGEIHYHRDDLDRYLNLKFMP
ncbi:hypothetical protein DYBT9275_04905 [Dyadobacter sp. CECT 9275]|uniref:Helix-turn-helix domain-containing protein n=1 Tax=Dyadobacter helix TaxID=2822344 RepID=A0A916NN84_9BACT|nr:hypothetical protein [Dyadobacter sp. CECT 9275]CAG5011210.1 hypothetical protein DYBT9275_04905 [Dyadobacter sp. CECT 9275]